MKRFLCVSLVVCLVFVLSIASFASTSVSDIYFTYTYEGQDYRVDSSDGGITIPELTSDFENTYLHIPFTGFSSLSSDVVLLSVSLTLDFSIDVLNGADLYSGIQFSSLRSLPFYGSDGRLFNASCDVSYRVGSSSYTADEFGLYVSNLYNDYQDDPSSVVPLSYVQVFSLSGLAAYSDLLPQVTEIRLFFAPEYSTIENLTASYDVSVVTLPVVDGLSSAFDGIVAAASSLFDFAYGTVGVYWILGISVSLVLVSIVVIRRFVLR